MHSSTSDTSPGAAHVQKEARIHDIFESISAGYDKMNDVISFGMHRWWKRALIKDLSKRPCADILDVASGTGDIAIRIAHKRPQSNIVASDFSAQMLEVARRRVESAGVANIAISLQNAMEMEFADDSFDCAVISFGLRNMPDYERVLQEMKRVVRPGGYLYCLDSSVPTNPLIKPLFTLYFKYLMPLLGRFLVDAPDQYRWLYDSTKTFLTKRELAALMVSVGLEDVRVKSHLFGSAARHRGRKPSDSHS
jgi:demethylmenaquinone methyltransferase/2-methoxy-6-polyprenyl-1,4-benzoquinol methylase